MRNKYEIRGDVTAIFVTGKGETLETLISTSDLERVDEFPNTWYANFDSGTGSFYVVGKITGDSGKRESFKLHRWIMNPEPKELVDHFDRDTLNNVRENLRIANHRENGQNRRVKKTSKTGIRGVSFRPRRNKYRAFLRVDGKEKHLGYYDDIKDAERAVVEARKVYMPFSNEEEN